MSRSDNVWRNEENLARLIKLWADGWSASEIAKVIPGCTRNSIIGKVNRMGMQRNPAAPLTPQQKGGHRLTPPRPPKPKRPPRPARIKPEPAVFTAPKISPLTGLRLGGTTEPRPPWVKPPGEEAWRPLAGSAPKPFGTLGVCRWPIDGFAEPMCCGLPRKDGDEAYCKAHRRRASSPVLKPISSLIRVAERFAA